eukprot:TRINITY_DN10397_c0_g1_i2.p1 TRINITY_DN10397_c0_g1~~TRINITY_DN10397_c0_g1_i2.p1  ORF type:complete len:506 (+),score=124.86 TRINITY_DN10397_c0_g1_i2:145-1662(+)
MRANSSVSSRELLDEIAKKLGVQRLEEWYAVQHRDFKREENAKVLLQRHGNSHIRAVLSSYPEFEWKEWKFSKPPPNYWRSHANQLKFMDDLARNLKLKDFTSWYCITNSEVIENGGRGLLDQHRGSIVNVLMSLYPQHDWKMWNFKKTPSGFWSNKSNHRKFMDHLAEKLNFQTFDDWYEVSTSQFAEHNGEFLLTYYGKSHVKAVTEIFSDHNWKLHRFKNLPQEFWNDKANLRAFMDDVGAELGVKKSEDWYRFRFNDIGVLSPAFASLNSTWKDQFGKNLFKILQSVYPEYEWKPWNFEKVPSGFWEDDRNVRSFVEDMAVKLGLKSVEEWVEVPISEVHKLGGTYLIIKYGKGGWLPVLSQIYPNVEWERLQLESRRKMKTSSKSQNILFKILVEMFPGDDVLIGYPFDDPESNKTYELDIFIPSLKLAFEYQGVQHYVSSDRFGDHKTHQRRDAQKKDICDKNGIILIEIPYWWDKSLETLTATILKEAPQVAPRIARK